MMTPERQSLQEVQTLLKSARPEQIERLLRDIMTSAKIEAEEWTGTA